MSFDDTSTNYENWIVPKQASLREPSIYDTVEFHTEVEVNRSKESVLLNTTMANESLTFFDPGRFHRASRYDILSDIIHFELSVLVNDWSDDNKSFIILCT